MRKLFGVIDMFCIVIVERVSQVHINIKSYLIVHFHHVQFIAYKLYAKADLGRVEGVLDLDLREGAQRPDLPLAPCCRWHGL